MSNTTYCPTCGKPTGMFWNAPRCFYCNKTVVPVEKPTVEAKEKTEGE